MLLRNYFSNLPTNQVFSEQFLLVVSLFSPILMLQLGEWCHPPGYKNIQSGAGSILRFSQALWQRVTVGESVRLDSEA